MAHINGNEIYFGIVGQVGSGDGGGYTLGEATAESTAAALIISDIGNYRSRASSLITDLQSLWDWDDENTLTWGCFSLIYCGSSGIAIKDSYNNNVSLYGGEWNTGANTSDSVKIIKTNSAIMIDLPGGSMIFFTTTDENNTPHRCVAAAKTGSTYRVFVGADTGTSASNYKVENNSGLRTTASIYELTPFFAELTAGFVKSEQINIVKACPVITNGLYSIGDDQFYFGNYVTLKDSN